MPLLPMLFSNWWEDLDRPHRIWDQDFGLPLTSNDLLRSSIIPSEPELFLRPSRHRRIQHYQPYDRSLSRGGRGTSTVQADKDKFHVNLDVQQFAPEEVSVKVVDRNVFVEGKHEEKQDEHGWISRQFSRKYLVPEQCDIDQLKSSLSSDGVLSIEAPRKHDPKEKKERVIPIQSTGQPAIQHGESSGSSHQQNTAQEQNKTPTRQQEKNPKTVKAA